MNPKGPVSTVAGVDEVPPLPLMQRLTHRGLTLGFSRESGRVTVRVTGELDAAGSGAVEAALRELTEGQGNLSIDLDLQDAQGLNSAFVMMLERSHRWMEAHGGVMTVNDPGPRCNPRWWRPIVVRSVGPGMAS